MSKFEKHIGKGEPLQIGEEEFILKPLDIESLPYFFKAMKAFSGVKEGADMGDALKNIDDEGLNAIKCLITRTLDLSYPSEPLEEKKQFGLKYMITLMNKIFEINLDMPSGDTRKQSALEKIKARMKVNEPSPATQG